MSRSLTLTMKRPFPLVFAASVLLPTLVSSAAPAAPNNSQLAKAQALFNAANKLMDEHRYDDACPKFDEVVHLAPTMRGAKLALCDCWKEAGKLASARTCYQQAAIMMSLADDPRFKQANDEAAAIEPRLSHLQIIVSERARQVSGLDVQLDGVSVATSQWDIAVPADPGKHQVTASAPGMARWSESVEVPANGGNVSIQVPVLKPQLNVPVWVWVTGGLGIASIVPAVGFLIDGQTAKGTLDRLCFGGICPPGESITSTRLKAREARGIALFTGFFIAHLVAGAVVTVGFVTAASKKSSAPSSVTVVPVLSPISAGVVVRGSF